MTDTDLDLHAADCPAVDVDASVASVEALLYSHEYVAVLNADGTVFGTLTARHLATFYQRPLNNPRATRVWEICNARPHTTSAGSALTDFADELAGLVDEPLLVLDEDDRLLGAITVSRPVDAMIRDLPPHRLPLPHSHRLH